MRRIVGITTALVATVLLSGGTSTPANAADVPFQLDRTVVEVGSVVHVSGEAGQESLNWVASQAFVRQSDDQYPGDGGSAELTVDESGHFEGEATIRDIAPGEYYVSARIGGGNAGHTKITVVR